jgi:amino acid permease
MSRLLLVGFAVIVKCVGISILFVMSMGNTCCHLMAVWLTNAAVEEIPTDV